jgi:beta-barrel assembly-enhancing protease
MNYRAVIHALFLASLLAIITGCASTGGGAQSSNPFLSTKSDPIFISRAEEIAIGQKAHEQLMAQNKLCPSQELQSYISLIGQRLVSKSDRADLEFHFTVFDSDVINAYALPGGFVYITTAIMAQFQDEAELAAVLGHEIGHVVRQHGVKHLQRGLLLSYGLNWMKQQAGGNAAGQFIQNASAISANFLMMRNSREDELEADEQGLKIASKAGYDPEGSIDLQKILLKLRNGGQPDLFSQYSATHPISEDRLNNLNILIPAYLGPTYRNKAVFQRVLGNWAKEKKAIEEAAAIEAAKPILPIEVTTRKAFFGEGLVITFLNKSAESITATAQLGRATSKESKDYTITLTARGAYEVGHLEGWIGRSGDTVTLLNPIFKKAQWTVK